MYLSYSLLNFISKISPASVKLVDLSFYLSNSFRVSAKNPY